jgi:hypothetical protein
VKYEPGTIVTTQLGTTRMRVLCGYEDYLWVLPMPKHKIAEPSPLTIHKGYIVMEEQADAAASDESALTNLETVKG